MSSHVENEIQARVARVRAEAERKRQEREELAEARSAGVARRHAAKLRHLSQNSEEPAMPAALRTAHCPSCRRDQTARLVTTVVVSGAPYTVLRCPDSSCELQWLVRADRPRTAPPVAA